MPDQVRVLDGGWRSCLRALSLRGGLAIVAVCLLAVGGARAAGLSLAGEVRGEHFIVQTYGRMLYAREVLRHAESYYQSIARRLGYDRYEKFWTWEDRCRIVLYPNKAAYLGASEGTEWTEGYANFRTREIVSYENDTRLLEKVLPHEIAHLILHDFVGPQAELPLWFDEGVALSQEQAAQPIFHLVAVRAIREGRYVPISSLGRQLAAQPVAYRTVEQFYAEASFLVDFWIDNFPRGKFVEFLRGLRVGLPFEEAFGKAFGPYGVETLEELEALMVAETRAQSSAREPLQAGEGPRLSVKGPVILENGQRDNSQVIVSEQVRIK